MQKRQVNKKVVIISITLIIIGIICAIAVPYLLNAKKEKDFQAEQEAIYHQALSLKESQRYEEALQKFELVKDYFPDAQSMIYQCSYKIAYEAAAAGDYQKAEQYLIPEKVAKENSAIYSYYWSLADSIKQWRDREAEIKEIDTISGTYQDVENESNYVVITNGTWYSYVGESPSSITEKELYCEDGIITCYSSVYDIEIYVENDYLIENGIATENAIEVYALNGLPLERTTSEKYIKISNSVEIPKIKVQRPTPSKTDPQIGMTADEVKKSSWGEPYDVNRTTTAYGIHEQWCYHNNRYIYLDDGIVTAIQD